MTCQRCHEKEAVARVRSMEGSEPILDMLVCAQCALLAKELGLELMEANQNGNNR